MQDIHHFEEAGTHQSAKNAKIHASNVFVTRELDL